MKIIRCKLFPFFSSKDGMPRPSLFQLLVIVALVLVAYKWILMRFERAAERRRKPIDDILEWNITQDQGSYENDYMLYRKTNVQRNYGDFSCSSSIRWTKCAYYVASISEATKICNSFGAVCVAFVLKSERGWLIVYLKSSLFRLKTDKNAALFVKKLFLPRLEAVRYYVRESERSNQ